SASPCNPPKFAVIFDQYRRINKRRRAIVVGWYSRAAGSTSLIDISEQRESRGWDDNPCSDRYLGPASRLYMPGRAQIEISSSDQVAAIAYPATARGEAKATYILGHGAGGNQLSPWIVQFATAAAARRIGVVTFNFLYSEQGRGLPDKNDKLEACWRK